ncbi:MAG: nuclear pore complex subunit [Bacteroidetes bacterium GWF2_33_16]|nr:MAG: nuclear pore complex subunit [Bacteroidetes bacterium GWE2_32_14]OFY03796.1 MAG: nuclear pore complex subunit [Bacteroidetes bacterium GWF2_33_16]
MESISIEGTPKTPSVSFDANTGIIEIKGRSIPENSIEFYRPLVEWLEEYSKEPQKLTTVNIQLEYFNTSSSKCILDVFKKLEAIKKARNEVIINWYYEEDDEDMLEAGEDYESIIRIPFKMIEVVD